MSTMNTKITMLCQKESPVPLRRGMNFGHNK